MDSPELIILDVGHGNSAILKDTEGVIIIDCALGATLVETLERLDIREINHVIISHADEDHIAGIITLLLNKSIRVHNIYLNSDASKRTKTWKGLRIAVKDARKRINTKVVIGLTTELTGQLGIGQVNVEILAPTPEIAMSGAGGEDLEGRRLTSNSVSAVIGLIHNSHRVAILAGDIDEVGLNNLLQEYNDASSDVLIFPHHGGYPGGSDSRNFARMLCNLVRPKLVIFSIGRGRFGNPRREIVQSVRSVVPEAHILCTQLSENCSATIPDAEYHHLTDLPAKGRRHNSCCGGTIWIKMTDEKATYIPMNTLHQKFITDYVSTPLCLEHITNTTGVSGKQ